MRNLRSFVLFLAAAVFVLATSPAYGNGTYIAGVLVYRVKPEELRPAPGQLVRLVVSSRRGADGEPEQPLDADNTDEQGRFVLGTNTVQTACALLIYPYPRDPSKPLEYLPKTVFPVKDPAAGNWRLKLTIAVTPTNIEFANWQQVSQAIEEVIVASRVAKALDISQDARNEILRADLKIVFALVPAEQRQETWTRAFNAVESKIDSKSEEPKVQVLRTVWPASKRFVTETLETPPAELEQIRQALGLR